MVFDHSKKTVFCASLSRHQESALKYSSAAVTTRICGQQPMARPAARKMRAAHAESVRAASHKQLPAQSRRQLHLAGRIRLRLPFTPVGVSERRSARYGAEPGAIQNVERLATKLYARPLLNGEDPR